MTTENSNGGLFWLQYFIPIIVALIGAAAFFWSSKQDWHRRRKFEKLVFRELEEVGPPPNWSKNQKLAEGFKGKFVHQKIFENHNENRDFILSLDASLVYLVNQLWNAFSTDNKQQWLYYLEEISSSPKYDKSGKIREAYDSWSNLIRKQ